MDEPKTDSAVIDDALNEHYGQETPEGSSPSEETQAEETEPKTDEVADPPKPAEESEEGKEEEAQGKGLDDPNNLMFKKGYNEAKAKFDKDMAGLKESLPPKETLDQFNKVLNSPEGIAFMGKNQGLTQEAIDERLREAGFEPKPRTTDDVSLGAKALGKSVEELTDEDKQAMPTYVKLMRGVFQDEIAKVLPTQLKPLQEAMFKQERERGADKLSTTMKSELSNEKGPDGKPILDFKKDIEPELAKFIDEEKPETQEEVKSFFKELKHRLTLERLQGKQRKSERDDKKAPLRSQGAGETIPEGSMPKRTGNPSQDIDNVLDHFQVQ